MSSLVTIPPYGEPFRHSHYQAVVKRLKLLVFDFDGVFTDNSVYVSQDGAESVRCSRFDGFGISNLKTVGIKPFVLSSEINPVVGARCKKLKLEFEQGCDNKIESLKRLMSKLDIVPEEAGFVGNDINDLDCLNYVGVPFLVADAHPSVLSIDGLITTRNGGEGAVREICDFICEIRKQDDDE